MLNLPLSLGAEYASITPESDRGRKCHPLYIYLYGRHSRHCRQCRKKERQKENPCYGCEHHTATGERERMSEETTMLKTNDVETTTMDQIKQKAPLEGETMPRLSTVSKTTMSKTSTMYLRRRARRELGSQEPGQPTTTATALFNSCSPRAAKPARIEQPRKRDKVGEWWRVSGSLRLHQSPQERTTATGAGESMPRLSPEGRGKSGPGEATERGGKTTGTAKTYNQGEQRKLY